MFQVSVILPVSTATCERSFSTMRRIKTWLRTCMNQDRFSNLSIMNIEKDIPINNEDILNIFEKNREAYTITLNIFIYLNEYLML